VGILCLFCADPGLNLAKPIQKSEKETMVTPDLQSGDQTQNPLVILKINNKVRHLDKKKQACRQ
jgi:hypothetical protein